MLKYNFSPFPELRTERLKLRQLQESDAAMLFELRSDIRIMKHIGKPLAKSIDESYKLIREINESIAKNESIGWAICLKETDTFFGTIGYWRNKPQHHRAEIGYIMHLDYHGKGFMTEALSAVVDCGFDQMGVHSIEAVVSPANDASINLLKRNKFVQEAYFREDYFVNGQFQDSVIFSLLESDWRA